MSPKSRKQRWRYGLVAAIALAALSLGSRFYKEHTMPSPFVYLIPEDYFGPVFVLFGQSDGVEMKPDPLGHAVEVTETGTVKIRAKRPEVMGITREGYRATYFVSVRKTGERRQLKMLTSAYREDGIWWQGVIDENTDLRKFRIGEETTGDYRHLPAAISNERMIINRDSCYYRFNNAQDGDKNTQCDQFLVISPNELLATSDWIWRGTGTYVDSVADFIERANEIHKKKVTLYDNSAPDPKL